MSYNWAKPFEISQETWYEFGYQLGLYDAAYSQKWYCLPIWRMGYFDGQGDRDYYEPYKPGDIFNIDAQYGGNWQAFVDNVPLGTVIAPQYGNYIIDPLMVMKTALDGSYHRLMARDNRNGPMWEHFSDIDTPSRM